MTPEDFETLRNPAVQDWLEKHLESDPAWLAFKAERPGFPLAPALTQLKLLQKSRNKLPAYFEARCMLPPRAYEQSSSERTAALKSYTGTRGLDLTCGLGVDSLYLSRGFEEWTSLEADPLLAQVAQYNFRRLGVSRVKVVSQTAEAFLEAYEGPPFDLVYVDPDRRDEKGRRLVRLEDCSPDVLQLLPLLRRHARRLLVKVSPLYDLAEAERLFPDTLTSLGVISVEGECKEVLIDLALEGKALAPVREVWIDREGEKFHFVFDKKDKSGSQGISAAPNTFPYILQPDVAFFKAKRAGEYFLRFQPELTGGMNHPEGFFFAASLPRGSFPGRIFQVKAAFSFKPKTLRKTFRKQALNIVRRHFPLTVKEIRKLTGIPEGGKDFLLCTQLGSQKMAFFCRHLLDNSPPAPTPE